MKLFVVVVVFELKVVKILVDRTRQGDHLSRKPQRADLIAVKALIMVPAEYADFANVFSSDVASEPPIYSLGPVGPSKSPVGAPRQAGKGLILPEDFLLADASIVFHLQQCRHMVCREGACLDDLHGCRQPSG